ncbi:MAG: beta strand repeat-containing protein, partial [Gemmataceae bacterium]
MDNSTINRTVQAYVYGATVDASDNVLVDGSMLGSITSTALAGSLGGFAADGAISDINETTNTDAFIDDGADVTAAGSVGILANRNTSLTTHDGSVAAGAVLGVNGSVSTVTKNDTVSAYVGANTSVTALGQGAGLSVPVDDNGSIATATVNGLSVAATAVETLQTVAIGASESSGFSGTGSATTNNITENTSALIDNRATVNAVNTGAASDQGVNVLASDETNLTSADGAAAVSLDVGAGIGAGVDIGNIQKTTTAGIENGANVNALGAVNVDGLSTETINTYVAAVGGSIGVGLAGTTADYSSHPIKTTTTAYVGSCTTSSSCSGGATVNAGSLALDANDNMQFNAITGELSAGAAALGAGTFEVVADGNTSAYVGALSDITTNTGGVSVNSTFTDNLVGSALAGSGGALASGAGAYGSITDNSNNNASIDDGVSITSAGAVNEGASTTRNLSVTTGALAVSAGLSGGAVIGLTSTNGSTAAALGNNVAIGGASLLVYANDNSAASSTGTAISAGIGSGQYNQSTADLGGSVTASIGNEANINVSGD